MLVLSGLAKRNWLIHKGEPEPGLVKKPETEKSRRDWYCKTVAQLRGFWRSKQPKSEGA